MDNVKIWGLYGTVETGLDLINNNEGLISVLRSKKRGAKVHRCLFLILSSREYQGLLNIITTYSTTFSKEVYVQVRKE